jgi:hypothetical protein
LIQPQTPFDSFRVLRTSCAENRWPIVDSGELLPFTTRREAFGPMPMQDLESTLAAAVCHVKNDRNGDVATREAREAICQRFLTRWFIVIDSEHAIQPHAGSGSYYFLFWKNLSVTNVSVVELIALIRMHAIDRGRGGIAKVDFLPTESFKEFFINTYDSFISLHEPDEVIDGRASKTFSTDIITKVVKDFVSFHKNIFTKTILFDLYWTSAIIGVPPTISLDVGAVTLESGYIHSSGIALYLRNIEKAQADVFGRKLLRFTKAFAQTAVKKRLFVTPYAQEYFGPYDYDTSASLRNGLDGVRIQLKKHYFEDQSLLDFLAYLQSDLLKDALLIPRGLRKFSKEREDSTSAGGAATDSTIWFITDHHCNYDETSKVYLRGRQIYIIAYWQRYFNENQLNIYKERKPAWLASTTLPHTLSAALINVAKYNRQVIETDLMPRGSGAGRATPDGLTILDPFCGTGTTLFDAVLRCPTAKIIGLDSSNAMFWAVTANLRFLSLDDEEVDRLLSTFNAIRHALEAELAPTFDGVPLLQRAARARFGASFLRTVPTNEKLFEFALHRVLSELAAAADRTINSDVSDADIYRVSSKGFSDITLSFLADTNIDLRIKIVFFAIWRSFLLNTFSMRDDRRDHRVTLEILLREVKSCLLEYKSHLKLMRADTPPKIEQSVTRLTSFTEQIGQYSHCGRIDPGFWKPSWPRIPAPIESISTIDPALLEPGIQLFKVDDSISVLNNSPAFADIIITDPPFGFNTFGEEAAGMKELYAGLVPALIGSLRSWGQLIVALPAFAKNGKQIPFFQTQESIVKQVLAEVEAQSRVCISFGDTVPVNRRSASPPWYWGGYSTIERRILHFTIK